MCNKKTVSTVDLSKYVSDTYSICLAIFVHLYVCIHVCCIITKIGLVVFNVRITVSAIYLALRLMFTHCISVLHCSRDLTN